VTFFPTQAQLDKNPPTNRKGTMPLLVGVSHEPFSQGDGMDWDLAIVAATPDHRVGPHEPENAQPLFTNCPSIYLPWSVASFAKRSEFALSHLLVKQTDPVPPHPIPKKFAAFMCEFLLIYLADLLIC
jgi:hypothetical protein